MKELVTAYEQNKVLANTRLRFLENGLQPVTTSGFVADIEQFYFELHPEEGMFYDSGVDCYYEDTRTALDITRNQLITVTGRISGFEYGDIVMFMCGIWGVDLERNQALTATQTRSSVVRVHCEPGNDLLKSLLPVSYGTGIIIDKIRGLVLTAHHVVEDCGRIAVEPLPGGARMAATLVKHCASVDQAYVQVERDGLSRLDAPQLYAASAPAQRDQAVYFWAWGSEGFRWQSGIVNNAPTLFQRDYRGVDAYAVPGDSGSPVFNEFGHLLGSLTRSNHSDEVTYNAWDCKPP